MNKKITVGSFVFFVALFFIKISNINEAKAANYYYNTPGGTFVTTPQGNLYIPHPNPTNTLSGVGMTFNTTVQIESSQETVTDASGKTTTKTVKKYSAYVRNCGIVQLPSNESAEKSVQNGDRVELKFAADRSCLVQDWRRF